MSTQSNNNNNNEANASNASSSIPQDYHHPMDPETFRKNAYAVIDYMVDYMKNVENKSVLSKVEPGYLKALLPDTAPEKGESFEAVMKDVDKFIMPGMTHWQSPNFFGYFPANSSSPATLADMLNNMFSVIGFSWICSPACTELETITMDWLVKALGLPDHFLSSGTGIGVIQGTASEAVIVIMLGAKARMLAKLKNAAHTTANKEEESSSAFNEAELAQKLVVYTSDQAHSSVIKATKIIGVSHLRILPANAEFQLDAKALEEAIKADKAKGLIPFCAVATLGTTSSTAMDRLDLIGPVCQEHDLWLHIDAAFAGSAFVCPEYRHYLKGIEYAHSFNFNPHKWLLTNFDCSALWVKERVHLSNALSITPEYLRNKASESGLVLDYRDFQLPLGRKFRALKLWFVLRMYGIQGLQEYIRHHIKLAEVFEDLVRQDGRFVIETPRTVSLVCFRLKQESEGGVFAPEDNKRLLDAINETGRVFLVHTVLRGVFVLRMAIGQTNTQERHVREAWEIIKRETDKLMQEKQQTAKKQVN